MLKKRAPIFHKVSNMLGISIFVSKIKKKKAVIIPKLIFLKKSRKLKRVKFLLLNKYHNHNNNYRFLQDYEFSPSSTPLIHCHKKIQFKKCAYKDNIYSLFFMGRCLGGIKEGEVALPLETVLPAVIIPVGEYLRPLDILDEEESVDQRAERFIERFYHEMRMEMHEPI